VVPVTAALPKAQQHDLQEVADMKAVRGTIEADIGAGWSLREARLEGVAVGHLMDEATRLGDSNKG